MSPRSARHGHHPRPRHPRWEDRVLYQVYPRSYADSDGDGVGDLRGILGRLGHLELLGVDGIWLNPVMRSPGVDHGYDVSDPRDVDPLFGTVDDLRELTAALHERDMVLLMDLVPNHVSSEHPWFRAALAAGPGSPERARFHFRDGRGPDGAEPPNNWPSVFGGPAWTRVTEADGRPGQWYLHLFAREQPDLDWTHPEVADDLARTLRFWLDVGVDGFRVDVTHGMAKAEGLPDMDPDFRPTALIVDDRDLRWDREGVHGILRHMRAVVDETPGAALFGELWVGRPERFARYLRPGELHHAFDFHLVEADFDAAALRAAIEAGIRACDDGRTAPVWSLANHDVVREVTRYGDGPRGATRARAMALVLLALPGIPFVYNGSELGLPSALSLPEDVLDDPTFSQSGGAELGRDNARVPLPWEGTAPPYGFTTGPSTWLPQPEDWAPYTVEAQLEDPRSTFALYREAIELRRGLAPLEEWTVQWYGAPDGCLAFRRPDGLVCAVNCSERPVPLPAGEVLLVSGPAAEGVLPPDTAAWLRP